MSTLWRWSVLHELRDLGHHMAKGLVIETDVGVGLLVGTSGTGDRARCLAVHQLVGAT